MAVCCANNAAPSHNDVQANRQTEIEVINGAIVAAGKRVGVATPVNETMVWMIEAKQAHYLKAKAA